jgi:hypothetical protein
MQLRHFAIFNIFVYYFCVSEFSKVGILKKIQKNKKQTTMFFLLSGQQPKMRNPTFCSLVFVFFSSEQAKAQCLSLCRHYTTNYNRKPNPEVHTTYCKSSQNTPFSSLCYLIQNQAIKHHLVIQVYTYKKLRTHLFHPIFPTSYKYCTI